MRRHLCIHLCFLSFGLGACSINHESFESENYSDSADRDCPSGYPHKGYEGICWETLGGGCLYKDPSTDACYIECQEDTYYVKGRYLNDYGSYTSIEASRPTSYIEEEIQKASQKAGYAFQSFCEAFVFEHPGAECHLEPGPTLLREARNVAHSGWLPRSIHGFSRCDETKANWQAIDNLQGCLLAEGSRCQLLNCSFVPIQDNVSFTTQKSSYENPVMDSHLTAEEFKKRFGADCTELQKRRSKKGSPLTGDDLPGVDVSAPWEEHGDPLVGESIITKPNQEEWHHIDGTAVTLRATGNVDSCPMSFPNDELQAIAKVINNESGQWLSLAPRYPTRDIFSLERALPNNAYHRPTFIYGSDDRGQTLGRSLYRLDIEGQHKEFYSFHFRGNLNENLADTLNLDVSIDGFECNDIEILIFPAN